MGGDELPAPQPEGPALASSGAGTNERETGHSPGGGEGEDTGDKTSPVPPSEEVHGPAAEPTYIPPGQYDELLDLIRQSSSQAYQAMKDAQDAVSAASAAGAAGQQVIARTMIVANTNERPHKSIFGPSSAEATSSLALCVTAAFGPSNPPQASDLRTMCGKRTSFI